jgi:hypothetical protein
VTSDFTIFCFWTKCLQNKTIQRSLVWTQTIKSLKKTNLEPLVTESWKLGQVCHVEELAWTLGRVWMYFFRPKFHQCTHPTDNPAIIHGPSKNSSWFCLPSLEFVPKSGNSLKKYVTVPYVPLVSRDHGRILFKFKPFGNVVPFFFYTKICFICFNFHNAVSRNF